MRQRARSTCGLFGLILLDGVYYTLLRLPIRLTGIHQADGIIGVLLGLYTCAQPAANALDFILFGRYLAKPFTSRRSAWAWWGLNLLVLLVGLLLMVASLLRFVR